MIDVHALIFELETNYFFIFLKTMGTLSVGKLFRENFSRNIKEKMVTWWILHIMMYFTELVRELAALRLQIHDRTW